MSERPRLLDLYCGAGGASAGYARAGFKVVGVDNRAQPRYPYEFHHEDALEALELVLENAANGLEWYAAIHASPPCQAHSTLRTVTGEAYVDLLTPTRELLEQVGVPYVIENVPGAPMRRDFILCGSAFGLGATCSDGTYRQLRRHRWFETNWPVGLVPPCHHLGEPVGVYGDGGAGRYTRGYKGSLSEAREALEAPWMSRREVSQAIPPAYTEYIGRDLMRVVLEAAAA